MQPLKAIRRVAGAFLLSLLVIPAADAQEWVPKRSGLPWASGVSSAAQPFARWRGRAVDVRTVFFGKKTWRHIQQSASTRPDDARMSVGFPMLPVTHAGQLAQCAAGAFDANMRLIRDTMLAKGWKGSLLRLGWEMNRIDRSVNPWAAKGDGKTYAACFRRWVSILNPGGVKNFVMVWNPGNQGSFPHPIENVWPGNAYVDIVGSNFYDWCPPMTTDAEFERRLTLRDRWGNPAGPKAWLEWAKARGKKWALPEWGVGGPRTMCDRPGFDNPFYIRKMHAFLSANARQVAYESYFNYAGGSTGSFLIYPSTHYPKAAAVYKQLW
jgi:hypothetical protein